MKSRQALVVVILIVIVLCLLAQLRTSYQQYTAQDIAPLSNTELGINLIISVVSFSIMIVLLVALYNANKSILKANTLAAEQVIIKSRFFTSISHEMRTPLNAILGVTEQLRYTPLNEPQHNMTNLLEASSSMLLSAVNEILDFSRLEIGKLTLSKTPFSYKALFNEVISTTTVLAQQKGLTLELHIENAGDTILLGDTYRLKQIVINLIANAIKFTEKGKISVEVILIFNDQDSTLLLVKVIDTGIGIAEKDLPFIFDEFSQVINNKRSDWQKGSGLGLPICKRLIELHEGKINVNSTVDKGSVFMLELPYLIAKLDQEELVNNRTDILHTNAFEDIHLLVVDDAKMNLLVIEMIFKKLNISYETALDGQQAYALFENNHYDLVLTDIEMPGMDGIELTKQIRSNANVKKSLTPIIAITGHISPESHQNYITAGLNDYLVKPYKEKELLEKILDYLV